jgi:hypothetical protein
VHLATQNAYPDCPWVCHHQGKRLKSIRTVWQTACMKLGLGKWTNPKAEIAGQRGCTGVVIHDFRRTAVKNLSDAGVPEKVTTSISAHKTCSVFDQYNIVSVARLAEAVNLVVARHQALLKRLDHEA